MKGIIVLTMEFPTPESAVEALQAMDPTGLPHFGGEARIAIGPDAEHVIAWLDEGEVEDI